MKLVLQYEMSGLMPLFPPVKIRHVSVIRPWRSGWTNKPGLEESESVWKSMTPVARGNYILQREQEKLIEKYPGKVLIKCNAQDFKTGVVRDGTDRFDAVVNISSADCSLPCYQREGALLKTVNAELKAVGDLTQMPTNEWQRGDKEARKKHVTLIIRFAYGKPAYGAEDENG